MLRFIFILSLLVFVNLDSSARTNSEIGAELYKIANIVKINSLYKSDEMKDNIASFLMDANMIGFDESNAVWKKLSSGWFYDSQSIKHYHLRHIGVYKSLDGQIMGVFDVNCEDINDVQERYFGYVKTTEVYFSLSVKPQLGHNKAFIKTFCK